MTLWTFVPNALPAKSQSTFSRHFNCLYILEFAVCRQQRAEIVAQVADQGHSIDHEKGREDEVLHAERKARTGESGCCDQAAASVDI
jgi:hypothetical protein